MYVLANENISDETDLTAIAALFESSLTGSGSWVATLPSTWTLSNIRAVDNSGLTENVGVSTPSVNGGRTVGVVTPNVALCISWPIAAHYRGGHPRTYVAGMPIDQLDTAGGKSWQTSTQSTWEGIGSALIAAIGESVIRSGVELALGTISYYTEKALRATPLFRTFEGAVVGKRIDSQRRRTGKEPALP
jgi:hypothetical protein